MSDSTVSAVSVEPGLTQTQRVIYTFTSPSKTFNDIKRSTSWWLPFVLTAIFQFGLFATIQAKVGWEQVAENGIRQNPKQAEQMDKQPADQRATSMKVATIITECVFAALPIFALIITAVIAGVLLATINFGFGGKATFWEVYAVSWYTTLPGLIKVVLGIAALLAGLAPESFNTRNISGTNIGYYLPPDTSKALMSLATSLDVITIWSLVLSAIGISIVAGTKRSAGYIAVFGWWILVVLIGAGIAVAT
jgi:Yip1 domain